MRNFDNFDSRDLNAQSISEPEISAAEGGNAIVSDFDLVQQPTAVLNGQEPTPVDDTGVVPSTGTNGQAVRGPVPRNLEGFLFLPSYLESYESLLNGGERERAHLLLDAIIAYGTQRKRITNDPVVTAIMMSIEKTIDAGAAKRAETIRKKQERAAKRKNPLLG